MGNQHSMGRGRSFGKQKKPKKAQKENWFERLTVDELKQICKAASFPVSGSKKVLIDRLVEDEFTRRFGLECPLMGCTVDSLKGMCKERNLVQSGTKFTLVMRVVQHHYGSAPEAIAAVTKRPAPQGEAAEEAKKKRKLAQLAKGPTKPSIESIHEKVLKKILSVDQKKYQSYYGRKEHSPVVYGCIHDILNKECIEKDFINLDPLFALQIAKTALVCLDDNFNIIMRPGYDYGDIENFCSILHRVLIAAMPLMSSELKNDTLTWIMSLDATLAPYGLGENFSANRDDANARFLNSSVELLKVKGVDDEEVPKDEIPKSNEKELVVEGVSPDEALVIE